MKKVLLSVMIMLTACVVFGEDILTVEGNTQYRVINEMKANWQRLATGGSLTNSLTVPDATVSDDLIVGDDAVITGDLSLVSSPLVTSTNAPGSSVMVINDLPATDTNAVYINIRLVGSTNIYVVPAFRM